MSGSARAAIRTEESRPMVAADEDADEEPNHCGSHLDKLWLFPFAAFCVALVYFGIQGIQEFNIYKAGEEQAKEVCGPLMDLESQCKEGLATQAPAISEVLDSEALQDLHSQLDAMSSPLGGLMDSCSQVLQSQTACNSLANAATNSTHRSAEECSSLATSLSDACSQLQAGSDAASAKAQDALDAARHWQTEGLKSFESAIGSSAAALCPVTDKLPKSCSSLREKVKESLHKVIVVAGKKLQGAVPIELVDAGLEKMEEIALGQVDSLCGNAANFSSQCHDMLSVDHWRPLLKSVKEPIDGVLKGDLADAAAHLGSAATPCSNIDGQHVDQACKDNDLGKVLKAWGPSSQKCMVKLPEKQCQDLQSEGAKVGSTVQSLSASLDSLKDFSGNVQHSCAELADLNAKCMAVANPGAELAKGVTGLWQSRATEIVTMELWLILACSITALIMLHVIKNHTAFVVTISIAMNMAGLVGLIVFNVIIGDLPGALLFLAFLLVKGLWLWCIRSRFAYAVRLIHCAVEAVQSLLGLLVWVAGLFLTVVQAGLLVLAFGCYYHLTGNNAPPYIVELNAASPALVPALIIFALVWSVEVASNALHIAICCSLGGSCGVATPASTFPGAFAFSFYGALGSNCAGSFWVAALKFLQHMLEKSEKTDNPCVKVLLKILCCLLEVVLKMYNSYAFVFVGLKGMSYCSAAKRTFQAMVEDGIAAVAADEALHDVVRIAKMVALYVSTLVALALGYSMGIIGFYDRSWQEVLVGPLVCIALASLTSYALTLTMGRLLEASVCTLFIVFGDERYNKCMKSSQQSLWEQLNGVAGKEEEGP